MVTMLRETILLSMLLGLSMGVEFTCENKPVGKSEIQGNVIRMSFPQDTYKLGHKFEVNVQTIDVTQYTLRSLAIQARDVSGQVWGTWESLDWSDAMQCGDQGGEMLYSKMNISKATIDLEWNVPMQSFATVVEFHITVMFDEQNFHTYVSPIARLNEEYYDPHNDPSEFEEPPRVDDEEGEEIVREDPDGEVGNPGESPNGGEELYGDMSHRADELDAEGDQPVVDLHDPTSEILKQREEEERRNQLIAAENANSEGEWSIREEEERRQREEEYDWELREQERIQYEEDKKREETILWEIRDKEEHDAMMAAQTSPPSTPTEKPIGSEERVEEVDDFIKDDCPTCGTTSTTASAIGWLLVFVSVLLI